MLSLIRRLFRRCPPHLVGRVPVDAGVGVAVGDGVPKSIVEAIKVHGGFMEAYREHHTKRQYEQAPALASGARPDWAMRDPDMERARIREAERARMHMVITEGGPITLQDYEAGRCRPSPAENAQRYSKPDWTW